MFKTFTTLIALVLILTFEQTFAAGAGISPTKPLKFSSSITSSGTLPTGSGTPLSFPAGTATPGYDPLTDTSNLSKGTPVSGGTPSASTGGGSGASSSAAKAKKKEKSEKLKDALEGYVIPTSTRNFSLSNLNSGNEASLIISTGNEENNVIYRVIRLIAMLVGTVAILLYIVAGYFMIFSQGNENSLTKGKEIVKFTSLGLVVTFGAYMIVQLVMGLIYLTT